MKYQYPIVHRTHAHGCMCVPLEGGTALRHAATHAAVLDLPCRCRDDIANEPGVAAGHLTHKMVSNNKAHHLLPCMQRNPQGLMFFYSATQVRGQQGGYHKRVTGAPTRPHVPRRAAGWRQVASRGGHAGGTAYTQPSTNMDPPFFDTEIRMKYGHEYGVWALHT